MPAAYAGTDIMSHFHEVKIYHFVVGGIIVSYNKPLDLSFEFAVMVVNIVDRVKLPKSSYMIEQLARSGTSIGANIHEAQYAQSKKILFQNWKSP